ncbi:MAG TPA: hypothetical protein V6D17_19410 [Candidatus Obscuribacterales bacterium]
MTTAVKTTIKPTWNVQQVQEHATQMMATQWLTAYTVLSKHGEGAITEFENLLRKNQVEHYKKMGVKTPIDLVKAKAEFEANLFGSKIEIWGDEKEAFLTYSYCGMWEAMKKYGNMTKEQEEKMGGNFQNCVSKLAQEFGFNGEVKFESETCATIRFFK